MKTLTLRAHQKSLKLTCTISPRFRSKPIGDVHRLRQIIVNLIGNAIKFTEERQRRHRGRCGTGGASQAQLHFIVRDTGIGVSEERRSSSSSPLLKRMGPRRASSAAPGWD